MLRFTESDGVLFTESSMDLQVLGKLSVTAPTQNTLLSDLKLEMAKRAKAMGGNGIINFTYNQKADKPFKNVFSLKWDTERLHGTGDVVFFETDPRN